MKQILILIVAMFIFTPTICAAQMSPDNSMKKFCNAFLYLDDADLKSLSSSPEEIREQYIAAFQSTGDEIKLTNEQKNLIVDALIDTMRKKIKFDAKTESVQGDKAVVSVTITGIKFNEELNDITFSANDLTAEQIAELATNEFISRIKNLENKEPVTIKFNLNYAEDIDLWIPEGDGENNLSPIFEAAL